MSLEEIEKKRLPINCPIRVNPEVVIEAVKCYGDEDTMKLYIPATITEKEAYQTIRGSVMAVRPRIKELIEFAKLLGAERIGMAFCSGLRDETSRLSSILEKQGFTVVSVVCKCGAVDKAKLGVDKKYKIDNPEKFESACNPILQAKLLTEAKTEINVIVGLCIGHDMLFTMYSKAPVTTIIVKDRLLGHNPVIGLYGAYHKDIIDSQKRT